MSMKETEPLCLYVEVPFSAFRPNWSREYQDTYPFPPPATVFGMLLSLCGIDWQDRVQYSGVKFAIALQGDPEHCKIFRKFRRIAQSNRNADDLLDRRPDYQELLLWLKMWVWVKDAYANESLVGKVRKALGKSTRNTITRYGGLSLGESSHLVNEISIKKPNGSGRFLFLDQEGYYQLPVWVSHPRNETEKTVMRRFSTLENKELRTPGRRSSCWVTVAPEQDRV